MPRHLRRNPTLIYGSGYAPTSNQCPLYPQKRTWISTAVMSALCQKRTCRPRRLYVSRSIARLMAFAYRRVLSHRSAKMSVEGLVLHHGEAHGVTLHQTRIDYLVTAEHSKQCSLFEFTVAPGFNTGVHYHTKIEEIFYVREGELDLRCGDRTFAAGQAPAYLCLPARRTVSETPARPRPGCY